MAKKRARGGRKAGGNCDPAEEHAALREEAVDGRQDEDELFDALIDGLYEKRAATRLSALNGLARLLASGVRLEECVAREETLSRLLLNSVRRGTGTEATLAARGLGLLIMTLGLEDGAERVWTETGDTLMKCAGNKLMAVELRCSSLDTYSIASFIVENDPLSTLESMARLASLWNADSHAVRECAIRGWTLLGSTLSAHLMEDSFYSMVERLTKLLEDPAVDVRRAASEAVALLHAFGLELESDDTDSSDSESSVASNSTGWSRFSGIDCAMDRMKDLAGPKGQVKRRSKRDRAAMRSTFREVCQFVEDGIVAEARIKLKATVLVVDDLPGLVQLSFIRKILAGGFQAHLNGNELLHRVFGYSPGNGAAPKMTKSEKRMFKSPQSDATRMRTQLRRNDYDAKMQMLEG
ncbi:unnamed protein product [Ostreobium quekettii]|uniref:Interferon-related developmental regulator N-terminal domain-containing protein n=1 Tax=Ostreobium quekettii TaxID=121088 RepID=A0A8S1J2I8_9CHLO|nr:unnamed protein product [Ostreobium quekettii]